MTNGEFKKITNFYRSEYNFYYHYNEVVFRPFGYGLSYTDFELTDLCVESNQEQTPVVKVSVKVENTGNLESKVTIKSIPSHTVSSPLWV